MASTRNKNTPGNYCLDQKQYTDSSAWSLYANGANGEAYDTRLAGNGLNVILPVPKYCANISGLPAPILAA